MIAQYKNTTVIVVGLGWEGWRVDGDVWDSVWEVLVGGCRAGRSCSEEAKIPFQIRVSVVERV